MKIERIEIIQIGFDQKEINMLYDFMCIMSCKIDDMVVRAELTQGKSEELHTVANNLTRLVEKEGESK